MNPNYLDRITSSPNQCGGRPCIRGMRVRVKDMLEMLGAGMSEQAILGEFPYMLIHLMQVEKKCARKSHLGGARFP
jgi:uncharacterized protein (DUF433 family)